MKEAVGRGHLNGRGNSNSFGSRVKSALAAS